MTPRSNPIIIAGSGPAGTALAACLTGRGRSVVVVDPAPDDPWTHRYGAWSHDWERTRFGRAVARTWDSVMVNLGNGPRSVPGQYVSIDNQRLRQQLRGECADTRFVSDRVARVTHHDRGSTAYLASGERLEGVLVIDATGRGHLTERPAPARAFQAAYGMQIRVRRSAWSADEATTMDFSVDHLSAADRVGPTSFLYALPQSSDTVFVEETSLAAAPAVSLSLLQDRLHARLAHLGVEVLEVLDEERCLIPMDLPLPTRSRTLAVGSAAGWVHPATGYHLSRALIQVEHVADAIAAGLQISPQQATRLAWRAIWPAPHRRTRALHDMGLQQLLTFNAADTRRFFDVFFSIPTGDRRDYLDATASPSAVARAMSRVFTRLPSDLRGRVLGLALGRGRGHLAQAVVPQFRGVR